VKHIHDVEALDRLFALTALLGDAMERDLRRRGLSRSRATILAYLHRGGPMSQRELAQALDVTPRNVTGLVDALVEDGLVTRNPHPTDRRATHVALTRSGAAAARELDSARAELATFLFAERPARETDRFAAALARLVDRLSDDEFAKLREAALRRWRRRRG
jgi:DNA-binding MarR family transcriptional regulator